MERSSKFLLHQVEGSTDGFCHNCWLLQEMRNSGLLPVVWYSSMAKIWNFQVSYNNRFKYFPAWQFMPNCLPCLFAKEACWYVFTSRVIRIWTLVQMLQQTSLRRNHVNHHELPKLLRWRICLDFFIAVAWLSRISTRWMIWRRVDLVFLLMNNLADLAVS